MNLKTGCSHLTFQQQRWVMGRKYVRLHKWKTSKGHLLYPRCSHRLHTSICHSEQRRHLPWWTLSSVSWPPDTSALLERWAWRSLLLLLWRPAELEDKLLQWGVHQCPLHCSWEPAAGDLARTGDMLPDQLPRFAPSLDSYSYGEKATIMFTESSVVLYINNNVQKWLCQSHKWDHLSDFQTSTSKVP